MKKVLLLGLMWWVTPAFADVERITCKKIDGTDALADTIKIVTDPMWETIADPYAHISRYTDLTLELYTVLEVVSTQSRKYVINRQTGKSSVFDCDTTVASIADPGGLITIPEFETWCKGEWHNVGTQQCLPVPIGIGLSPH